MDDISADSSDVLKLETARALSGLGRFETWVRYFSLGGQASPLELDAFFNESMIFPESEYNIVVHALNERLQEIDLEPFLELRPFAGEEPPPYAQRHDDLMLRAMAARAQAIEMRISASEMRISASEMHAANERMYVALEEQLGRTAMLLARFRER